MDNCVVESIKDNVVKYIFILLAIHSGWTVKTLNDKTFEFRKKKPSKRMSKGKHFIDRFSL